MKRCVTCKRTFDDSMSFCLVDGMVLSAPFDSQDTSGSDQTEIPTEVYEALPTQIAEPSMVTKSINPETSSVPKPPKNSPGKSGGKIFMAGGGLALIAIITLLALYLTNRQPPQQISAVETPAPSPTPNRTETAPSQPAKTPLKVEKERVLQTMNGFKIGIYYWQGDSDLAQKAARIKERLTEYGLKQIVISPKNESFFEEIGKTYSDEVRFEEGIEDEQAENLKNLLNEFYPGDRFKTQPVSNRTENFISIILGEEPKN